MKLVFLGTGVSHGIPVIGCDCEVCVSPDPRDRRLRSALHVESGGVHLQIDTPPDFRTQALIHRVRRVDAVFYTHAHADHIFGLDDLRRFNEMQGDPIDVYAGPDTCDVLRTAFDYALRPPEFPGVIFPQIRLRPMTGPVCAGPFRVSPLDVRHGPASIFGFLVEADGARFAYIPDCSALSDATIEHIRGCDLVALDSLRPEPHPTHLSLPESVRLLERIAARRSYLTHLSHRLGHRETEAGLHPGIRLAYDGLTLELPDVD